MSQLETQSTAPPSTVAAIHYGQVVGEAWDNDNYSKTVQISMVTKSQKLQILGLMFEKLMIDSGAQCCVCPVDSAPEIQTVKVDQRELPTIHSVTGATMKVDGVKYVTYQLANHHEMTVRYYVTDVKGPILSVNGLNKTGYSPVLSADPYLMYFDNYITKLEKNDGLYYVVSK